MLTSSEFDRDERVHGTKTNCPNANTVTIDGNDNTAEEYKTDYYYADCDNILTVNIKSTASITLAAYLFSGCTKLKEVKIVGTIPSLSIGEGSFAYCSSLKTFSFDNVMSGSAEGYVTLSQGSFFKCTTSLANSENWELEFPSTLKSFPKSCFEGCTHFVPTFKDTTGYSVSIGPYAFYQCNAITNLNLPDSMSNSFDEYAFADCSSLVLSSKISASRIGPHAFDGSTYTNLVIDCRNIGAYAFKPRGIARSCSINNFVKRNYVTINEYAFSGVTIKSVCDFTGGTIGPHAFEGCAFTQKIEFDQVTIGLRSFAEISPAANSKIKFLSTSVGERAFENIQVLISLNFDRKSSGTLQIGDRAFYGSNVQGSLDIPQAYRTIGNQAFADCSDLKGNLLLDHVSTIKSYAFQGCHFNGAIRIIGALNIYESAFEGMLGTVAQGLVIGEEKTKSTNGDSQNSPDVHSMAELDNINRRAFYGLTITGPLVIHSTVKKIDEYSFAELTLNGKSQVISIHAQIISPYAFANCKSTISNLNIYSNSIGFHAFDGCTLGSLKIAKKINYPEDSEILEQAFYGLKIGSLEISSEYKVNKEAFCRCTFSGNLILNCATIKEYAFADSHSSNPIEVNFGNTEIGDNAFENFATISQLKFDGTGSNKNIGKRAFYGAKITNNNNELKIPSYSSIGDYAFAGITNLQPTKLVIESNDIGESAFEGCSNIQKLELIGSLKSNGIEGNGVAQIGKRAFYNSGLNDDIEIPVSVTDIQESAFQGLQLKKITLYTNSLLETIGRSAFQGTTIKDTLQIPKGVEEISPYAFAGCKNLKTLVIYRDSVLNTIGECAFQGCTGLDCTLDIPSKVTTIGERAFADCTGLKGHLTLNLFADIAPNAFDNCGEVVVFQPLIPSHFPPTTDEETKIKEGAFKGFQFIKEIRIPNQVTEIKPSAFEGCTNLQKLTFENGGSKSEESQIKTIGKRAFYDSGLSGTLSIPKSVKTIDESAFEGCTRLTTLILEHDIESSSLVGASALNTIGDRAFYGTGLTAVSLPIGLEILGASSFESCNSLQKLSFDLIINEQSTDENPIVLTKIGDRAFYGTPIDSFEVPLFVTTIGKSAFEQCTNLKTITYATYEDLSTVLSKISDRAFYGSGLTGPLSLPSTVETIGEYAFANCSKLGELTFEIAKSGSQTSSSLSEIKKGAFANSSISGHLTIPLSITSIGESAFESTTNLDNLTFQKLYNAKGEEKTVPLSTIGNRAFYGSGITGSLTLYFSSVASGSSDPNVGDYAFANCERLAGPIEINKARCGDYVFSNCRNLGETVFNEKYDCSASIILRGGTTLGKYVVEGCTKFKGTVLIENGKIGDSSFEGYTSSPFSLLINPDSKNSFTIGDRAFYGSSIRGPLSLPKSVTKIGKDAFSNCRSISNTLYLAATNIGRRAFAYSAFSGILTIEIEEKEASGSAETGDYKPAVSSGFDETTFYNCSGFTGLSIVKLVTIPDRLFYQMSFFQGTLSIPKEVKSIGRYAFAGCGFSEVSFDPDADGEVEIGEGAFSRLTELTGSIDLPKPSSSSVSTHSDNKIHPYTYYQCENLRSFTMPTGINEIGDYAFYGCRNLEMTLDLTGINTVGVSAFQGCSSLRGSLVIPKTLTEIKENAFAGCTGLSGSLTIRVPGASEGEGGGDSQTKIRAGAFSGCEGFKKGTLTFFIEGDEEKERSVGDQFYYGLNYFLRIENKAFEDCKFSDIYYNGRFEPDCDYDIGIKHTKAIHTSSNYANKSFCSYPLHKDKLSGGAIAGICIAVIVVVAALIVLAIFLIIRMKRNKDQSEAEVEMNADP